MEPTVEGDAEHKDVPRERDIESPSKTDAEAPKPRATSPHVLLESAVLGRASEGKTVDGVVYLRISDASQDSGIPVEEILAMQQELALRGIVIRRGRGDVCWVGVPLEEKPDKRKR